MGGTLEWNEKDIKGLFDLLRRMVYVQGFGLQNGQDHEAVLINNHVCVGVGTISSIGNQPTKTKHFQSFGFHGSLWWRHNGRDYVANHQPHDCLLNRLLRRRSKTTSKLPVTGLCAGNSAVTGEFPAQRASNAENVSIWWRHNVILRLRPASERRRYKVTPSLIGWAQT